MNDKSKSRPPQESDRRILPEGYQPSDTIKKGYQPNQSENEQKQPPSGDSNVTPPPKKK